jgi:hypothetical protein
VMDATASVRVTYKRAGGTLSTERVHARTCSRYKLLLFTGKADSSLLSLPSDGDTLQQVMPQLKIQDGVGLLDAEFNGSFVLQCITCQCKREIALGPPTIPFPNCNLCGGRSNCTMRQKPGVVFVNLIDRVNQIVRRTLQL